MVRGGLQTEVLERSSDRQSADMAEGLVDCRGMEEETSDLVQEARQVRDARVMVIYWIGYLIVKRVSRRSNLVLR